VDALQAGGIEFRIEGFPIADVGDQFGGRPWGGENSFGAESIQNANPGIVRRKAGNRSALVEDRSHPGAVSDNLRFHDAQFRENLCHGNWMRDIRLATLAKLTLMSEFSDFIGLLNY
jgi:hypothetical protein